MSLMRGIARGRVTEEWGRDLQGRPKLNIMKSLYESGHRSSCACVPNKVLITHIYRYLNTSVL